MTDKVMHIFILVLFCLSLTPNEAMAQKKFDFLPAPVQDHQILKYEQFTLSYNKTHEQAEWVAYLLTKAEAEMKGERCGCFNEDKNVKLGSATKDDYASTGFDKGHLSPSADNQLSKNANKESFLMSNMSPQLPAFNRGIWADLEEWVRQKAIETDSLYIVTGAVFVNNLGKIGKNEVTIPGYFYKVLLRFEKGKPKMIGFLLPQLGASDNFNHYVVPVNSIETLTGLDFFPALEDTMENKAEGEFILKSWGLSAKDKEED
jgi:endonuclease G, mitochondrial